MLHKVSVDDIEPEKDIPSDALKPRDKAVKLKCFMDGNLDCA
jgi:hypothetical protein